MKRKQPVPVTFTQSLLRSLTPEGPLILKKKYKGIPWIPFQWETATPEVKQKVLKEVVNLAAEDGIPIGPPCHCILDYVRYVARYAQLCMQTKLDEKKTHHRVLPRLLYYTITEFLLPSKTEIIFQSVKDPYEHGSDSFIIASFGWCSDNMFKEAEPKGFHKESYVTEEPNLYGEPSIRFPCSSYILSVIGNEPEKLSNFTPHASFELWLRGQHHLIAVYNTHEISGDLFWKYGGISGDGGFPYDVIDTSPFFDNNSDW